MPLIFKYFCCQYCFVVIAALLIACCCYCYHMIMAPKKKVYKCPKCNITVTGNSIGCPFCDDFFHIACLKITKEQHAFLYKNKNFLFKCTKCMKRNGCNSKDSTAASNVNDSSSPSNNNINMTDELRKCFSDFSTSLETQHENYKIELNGQIKAFEEKIVRIVDALREEVNSKFMKLDQELKNCYDMAKSLDTCRCKEIRDLHIQHDIMQRRLNRANVVVNGLPDGIKDLRQPILKIASLCGLDLCPLDIQHCCYFLNGKSVLIKFNSIFVRDTLMAQYHKGGPLYLRDVTGDDVGSRVFLNDHLNSTSSKLIYLCKKLKSLGKIQYYKLFNADKPKVEVIMFDGSNKELDIDQCAQLLDETGTPTPVLAN